MNARIHSRYDVFPLSSGTGAGGKGKSFTRLYPAGMICYTTNMTKRKWPDILFISMTAFLLLLPSLKFGFVNLDDNFYVTDNIFIRHLSLNNIIYFFTSFHHGVYAPLQYLTYMLLYAVSGYHAMVYHLTGIIFHILCGVMVYLVVDAIQHDRITALFSSLLFLVTPVNIDSAVWIAELKNPQSLFFFLTAFYLYAVYRNSGQKGLYAGSLTAFLLGLLVKPPGATILIMMFLYDRINRRTTRNSMRALFPYAAAAFAFMIDYMVGQARINTFHGLIAGSLWAHIKTVTTVAALLFEYPSKLLLPVNLSAAYPIDTIIPGIVFAFSLVLIALIITGTSKLLKNKDSLLVFWIAWYFVNMLPYYGIIAMPFFTDWYLYVASIGLYTFLSASVQRLSSRKSAYALLCIIVLVYGFLGFKRQFVWKNDITLWKSSLRSVGNDQYVLRNLAIAYFKNRNIPEGVHYGNMLLEITPDFMMMKYLIAKGYYETGQYTEARDILQNALDRLNNMEKEGVAERAVMPGIGDTPSLLKAMIYTKIADIDVARNQAGRAAALLITAVSTAPYNSAYEKLAYLYVQEGKTEEAKNLLEKFAALKPLDPGVWRMLGYITARYYNDKQLAGQYFQRSLEIDPDQKYAGEINQLLKSWQTGPKQ